MSRAGRRTKRRKSASPKAATGDFVAFLKARLLNPDPRSHAEFLRDMRTRQAAGKLKNPATATLLDRLERAIAS